MRNGQSDPCIERQDAELLEWAHAQSHEVVVQVRDKAVSGDIDLYDRLQLGEWLTEEARSRWDVLAVTTQDRLSRNDIHCLAFVFKIIEWGKNLVVLDDPTLDLFSVEGRLIAHAKAIGPAKELERIKARVRDSHRERRYTPQWHGGCPPYGYTTMSVTLDGGTVRRVLVLDEYKKMPIMNHKWSSTGLKMILTSMSCRGVKLNGRDADAPERRITVQDRRRGLR